MGTVKEVSDRQAPLQKLLALDKNFQQFDDQLDEVCSILKIDNEVLAPKEHAKRQEYGRLCAVPHLGLVLRWLLDKLNSPQPAGQIARKNPRSWALLGCLLASKAIAGTSALPKTASFLELLQNALQESFTSFENRPTKSDEAQVQQPSVTKKRKRKGTPVEDSRIETCSRAQDETTLLALFTTMRSTLAIAISISKSGLTDGSGARVHMQKILTTTTSTAAALLKLWCMALESVPNAHENEGFFPDTDSNGSARSPLSPMLDVWRLAETSNSKEDTMLSFANSSMLPVLRLLQKYSQDGINNNGAILRGELENLISSQILFPAREVQLSKGDDACTGILDVWLGFVKGARTHTAGFQTSTISSLPSKKHDRRDIADLVPLIWSIALRTTTRDNQKRKATEKPWLVSLFRSLAKCVSLPLDADMLATADMGDVQCLATLLDIAAEYEFQFDTGVLATVTRRYSNVIGYQGRLHWNLIIAVMRMDSSVFLVQNTDFKAPERARDLGDALFDALSRAKGASMQTAIPTGYDLESIEQRVLIPLIKAHAASRSLENLIKRWHAEIVSSVGADNAACGCVWESAVLRRTLVAVLESSLSSQQIARVLTTYVESLALHASASATKSSPSTHKQNLRSMDADIIILDALVEGLVSDDVIDELLETISQSYAMLAAVFSDKNDIGICQTDKLWRLLCKADIICRRRKQGPVAGSHLDTTALFEAAISRIRRASNVHGSKELHTMNEALGYALNVFAYTERGSESFRVRQSGLESIFEAFIPASPMKAWKVTIASTRPNSEDAIYTLLSSLLYFPAVLELLQSKTRCLVFRETLKRSFYHRIRTPQEIESSPDARHYDLLRSFLDLAISSGHRNTLTDLFQAFRSAFDLVGPLIQQGNSTEETSAGDKLACLLFDLLLPTMPSAIPRESREHFLDLATSWVCDQLYFAPRTISKLIAFLMHLMSTPNATSKVCLDAKVLLKLSQNIKLDFENLDLVSMYHEFLRLCVSHVCRTKEQPRSKQMLEELSKLFDKRVQQTDSAGSQSAGLILLHGVITSVLSEHGFQEGEQDTELLLDLLSSATLAATAKSEGNLGARICMTDDILTALSSRSLSQEDTERMQDLYTKASKSKRKANIPSRTLQKFLKVLSQHHVSVQSAVDDCRHSLESGEASARTQLEALDMAKSILEDVDIASKATLAESLSLLPHERKIFTAGQLQVLAVLLQGLERGETVEQTYTSLLRTMSKLCLSLDESTKAGSFSLAVACLMIPLKEKPWLLTQSTVDALLSALQRCSSPSNKCFTSPAAGHVFLGICTLSQAVISLHRVRLGGRFHLLSAILRQLLTILHEPLQTMRNSSGTRNLLTSKHASAYGRVLATLCSPTQSSVVRRRRSSQNELVDETKVAKQYSGEYVREVIATFCTVQLDGTLGEGMREALNPGLWAAMEVIGEDGLKVVSSGLNTNTRAVLRSLVSNWKRFGRSENR